MWAQFLVPALILGFGLANYLGVWRGRVLRAGFPQLLFAPAWLGGSVLLVVVGGWLAGVGGTAAAMAGGTLVLLGVAGWVVSLVFFLRMPRRLYPGWYRHYWADAEATADPAWSRRQERR